MDRAKIFTNEMKGRSRLGNILGELQGISEQTRSAPARQSIRHAMMEMARASFMPLTSGTIGSIGLNLEPDYSDTLATAAAAMGVQLGDTCPSCGVVHDGGGMTLQELIALADDQWDGDPVAEAMVNVEGVQA